MKLYLVFTASAAPGMTPQYTGQRCPIFTSRPPKPADRNSQEGGCCPLAK